MYGIYLSNIYIILWKQNLSDLLFTSLKKIKCIQNKKRSFTLTFDNHFNSSSLLFSSQKIENQQIMSVILEGFWQVAAEPRVIRLAKMFGCSRIIAHSLVRLLEQIGISINAQDKSDVRKQCQDETVNLHSRIDVSGSSHQL